MSLPSVSPLWRSKTQNSGSACSRTPYSSQQRWLWPNLTREGNKWVRCIRNLQRPSRQLHDITVIWSFQTGLETTTCGARVGFHLFASNSLFATTLSWTGWVEASNLTSSPGVGNRRYAPLFSCAESVPKRLPFHHLVKWYFLFLCTLSSV